MTSATAGLQRGRQAMKSSMIRWPRSADSPGTGSEDAPVVRDRALDPLLVRFAAQLALPSSSSAQRTAVVLPMPEGPSNDEPEARMTGQVVPDLYKLRQRHPGYGAGTGQAVWGRCPKRNRTPVSLWPGRQRQARSRWGSLKRED